MIARKRSVLPGCSKHLRSRPWDVMKVPNQIAQTERPQFCRKRNQVIIVHPYEVAWTDKLHQRLCECPVNSQVAGIVRP